MLSLSFALDTENIQEKGTFDFDFVFCCHSLIFREFQKLCLHLLGFVKTLHLYCNAARL